MQSSGRPVRVQHLSPLSNQMNLNSDKQNHHQDQYRLRGVYGVMDLAKKGQVQQADALFNVSSLH